MSAAKRKREVQVNFRVSPEELALIEQKMSQLGTVNREAYCNAALYRRRKKHFVFATPSLLTEFLNR